MTNGPAKPDTPEVPEPAMGPEALPAESAGEDIPDDAPVPAAQMEHGSAIRDQVLETYPLHPAAARVWGWMLVLVILAILLPLSFVATVFAGRWALLAALLAGALVWRVGSRHLRMAVERFRCERFERGLRYRHGVWWQSETFVPAARVQHTEVNQGPIARRFGLGTLKVYTAAVQLGALEIDGLAYADALLLRDRLLRRDKESPDAGAHGGQPMMQATSRDAEQATMDAAPRDAGQVSDRIAPTIDG